MRRFPEPSSPSPVIPIQRAAPEALGADLPPPAVGPVTGPAGPRERTAGPVPAPRRAAPPSPVEPEHPIPAQPSAGAPSAAAADRAAPASDPVADELRELRGLVHDLGNGLSTMALLLEAARGGSVPTFGLLELIEQETDRLLAVLHSDRTTAVPGAAPATTDRAPVVALIPGVPPGRPAGAPVGVRAVLEPLVRVAGHAGATAVTLQPGPEQHVLIDPAALSRVVGNLVQNAVRAAGPAGAVQLSVAPGEPGRRQVVLDVVDDGPGFPHGPPGTARIGLDLVHRLLTACAGRLELHGVQPHGTRARVVLPGAGPRPVPPGPEPA